MREGPNLGQNFQVSANFFPSITVKLLIIQGGLYWLFISSGILSVQNGLFVPKCVVQLRL